MINKDYQAILSKLAYINENYIPNCINKYISSDCNIQLLRLSWISVFLWFRKTRYKVSCSKPLDSHRTVQIVDSVQLAARLAYYS